MKNGIRNARKPSLRERLKRTREYCAAHKALTAGVLAIAALGAGIATYASVEATSTVAFCTLCHEMGPAYESYLKSSHYKVEDPSRRADCRDCHVPPWSHPVAVLWTKTYHGVKDVTRHITRRRDLMMPGFHERMRIQAPHGIHNASCLACHGDVYDKTYEGRTNIHANFRESPASRCTDCHRNLVHADAVPVFGAP